LSFSLDWFFIVAQIFQVKGAVAAHVYVVLQQPLSGFDCVISLCYQSLLSVFLGAQVDIL
jgi:hypothetical protein